MWNAALQLCWALISLTLEMLFSGIVHGYQVYQTHLLFVYGLQQNVFLR